MANATDDLNEAENLIQKVISDRAIGKSLEICRWLLAINTQEKHTIKCYQTNRPDIRFCIDRGTDCSEDGAKIMTNFLVIGPSLELLGLYSTNPDKYSYFKPDQKRWRINSKDASELPMSTICEHIFESYCLKLKKLDLVSKISRLDYGLQQNCEQHLDYTYLPNKDDFKSAYRLLTRFGETISIDSVLDQIENNTMKKGLSLRNNWRMITEKNIEIWSNKN